MRFFPTGLASVAPMIIRWPATGIIFLILSFQIGAKEVIHVNENDLVTLREGGLSFNFSSQGLPGIDISTLCAGDLSQIDPLLVLLEPYVSNINSYSFITGVEGPLCTKREQSHFSRNDYYHVLLTQSIERHTLWDIEARVTVREEENITTSFRGHLFRIDLEERRPEGWLSIEQSHRLALESILEIAKESDPERLEEDGFTRLGSGITAEDEIMDFVPFYELWIGGYESMVNRATGEVTVSKTPPAMP